MNWIGRICLCHQGFSSARLNVEGGEFELIYILLFALVAESSTRVLWDLETLTATVIKIQKLQGSIGAFRNEYQKPELGALETSRRRQLRIDSLDSDDTRPAETCEWHTETPNCRMPVAECISPPAR